MRAELGGLSTVEDVLAAARGEAGDPDDPAVAALRRAARLRAEALATAGAGPGGATGDGSGTGIGSGVGTGIGIGIGIGIGEVSACR